MTRNLKVLGLVLAAICALGAAGASGASADTDHEFHSDGEKTVFTGSVGTYKFQFGEAWIIECTTTTFEATQKGTLVSADTYKSDTITVVPNYSGCTFAGQPATVFMNHCAYVFDTETTKGNPTAVAPEEHANFEIECFGTDVIRIHTVNCTITIGPQLVKHAVRYKNEAPAVPSAFEIATTAHNIVVGKERTTASQPALGCLSFPTGAVVRLNGTTTTKCFRDEAASEPEGTAKTTPPAPKEGPTTDCAVSPGA